VQEQVYALRQRELELRINDALLEQEARKRKVTTNALLETEVASKIKQVTEEEARVFYEQNKARLGAEFAPVRDRIIQYLQERAVREAQLAFATQLRRAASVQTFLARPEPPVYEIATDDQPVLGNTAAPVTIVEFTDYQCPSCAAAQPLVEQLVRESGGRVRLVVRDFPLEQHAEGFKAAEAAEAAREQGKYWEYVALLMRNQTQLGVARLKEYAARLSLDRAKFDAALDSGKFSDKVQRDIRDGLRLGVHTTPTIFVNGRMVSDPTPEQLKAALDAALRASAAK
jgi:protein-disulfide isomerase